MYLKSICSNHFLMQITFFNADDFDESNEQNFLGKGGQGEVHLLKEIKTKKEYAVKCN